MCVIFCHWVCACVRWLLHCMYWMYMHRCAVAKSNLLEKSPWRPRLFYLLDGTSASLPGAPCTQTQWLCMWKVKDPPTQQNSPDASNLSTGVTLKATHQYLRNKEPASCNPADIVHEAGLSNPQHLLSIRESFVRVKLPVPPSTLDFSHTRATSVIYSDARVCHSERRCLFAWGIFFFFFPDMFLALSNHIVCEWLTVMSSLELCLLSNHTAAVVVSIAPPTPVFPFLTPASLLSSLFVIPSPSLGVCWHPARKVISGS